GAGSGERASVPVRRNRRRNRVRRKSTPRTARPRAHAGTAAAFTSGRASTPSRATVRTRSGPGPRRAGGGALGAGASGPVSPGGEVLLLGRGEGVEADAHREELEAGDVAGDGRRHPGDLPLQPPAPLHQV